MAGQELSYCLGQEPGRDLGAITTPEERLNMMWPLAREAWFLAVRDLQRLQRQDAPMSVGSLSERPC